MMPFQSLSENETFLYSLPERVSTIHASTLVLVRRGAQMAIVSGELTFTSGHRLVIYEVLNTRYDVVQITSYGYETWHSDNLLY